MAWEIDFLHIVPFRALYYLGGLKELSLRLPGLIREARERDDLLVVAALRIRHSYLTHLASDEPGKARENLRQIIEKWSHEGFHNQHYWAMIAQGEIALFERDAKAAWDLLSLQWPSLKKSRLLGIQLFRIESLHLRARSAIACAGNRGLSARDRETFLRSAERDVHRLEREGTPWGHPLAELVRAGIAAARRDLEKAARILALAEDEFTHLDMALYAAAARRRQGEVLGGEVGRALVENADTWMSGQLIKNPARMADMLAPGSWSR